MYIKGKIIVDKDEFFSKSLEQLFKEHNIKNGIDSIKEIIVGKSVIIITF